MDDHPPIARPIKAQVLFDTTVPRYFAVINECSVHVCMMIAIRELLSVEASWALYGRLLAAGLRPRNPARVGFDDAAEGDYIEIVDAVLRALARGTAKRMLDR